jgi:hypothetical protein
VIQLAGIVDREVAQVITVKRKIGPCHHVLHFSKLLIAGCTVIFIELIHGPLKGFPDFGHDIPKDGRTIVIKGHYNLSLERRPKLALSNTTNALKGQIGDCWLIRFDKLGLEWRAFGYRPSIAVARVNISLQVAMFCVILQSFVVPQESGW